MYIADAIRNSGLNCFTVPEVATMTIKNGVTNLGQMAAKDDPRFFEIERSMFFAQRMMAGVFREYARAMGGDSVILFDRAELDIEAYVGAGKMNEILNHFGLDHDYILAQYDMVIHLVTTAFGAEECYSVANNSARIEKRIALARESDRKTLKAWSRHKNLVVIGNDGSFDDKISKAVLAASTLYQGGNA